MGQVLALVDDLDLIIYVHAAPPCGTCSRAREKRIPFRLRKRGIPDPLPLRSLKHPNGLPNLRGVNQQRVSTANSIYRNIGRIFRQLPKSCILSLENPTRSHLWNTTWVSSLITDLGLIPITFQACMHGSKRDKWSTFYVNDSAFSSLAITCDGSHTHLPWTVTKSDNQVNFSTANEAAYPELLCQRLAAIVANIAVSRGVTLIKPIQKKKNANLKSQQRAVEAGRQPRGNLLPQLLSEFGEVINISCPAMFSQTCPRPLTDAEKDFLHLQREAKLLSISSGAEGTGTTIKTAEIGLYRTEEEFVHEALKLRHPFDSSSSVPDDAKRAMFWLLTSGPGEVKAARDKMFEHYEKIRDDILPSEDMLHLAIDPSREKLIHDKQVLLFRRLCEDAGVDDPGLTDILVNGVKLTGQADETSQFESLKLEPTMTDIQLMKSSRWTRKKILSKERVGSTTDVRKHLWQEALTEVDKGWLSGPHSEYELEAMLGPRFVVSRRFGLVQSDKIRAIDDLSESFVNAAYGSSYKLDLPGIDGVSTMARTWLEAISEQGDVSFRLSNDLVLRGRLHDSLEGGRAFHIRGRTLDLDAAYKQILISKSSLWCSVLAIENPAGAKKLFLAHVLPFGASASVYAFNRLARALHTIGERIFGLVWSNYYDDYPQLDVDSSGGDAQKCAERLFDLLGWRVSFKETKRKPMSLQFDVLGVTFDFQQSSSGNILVRNKASRIQQIVSEVNGYLHRGELSLSEATSLRGKLQFADTHTFGRLLAANLHAVSARACGKSAGNRLDAEMITELRWIINLMTNDIPRIISSGMAERRLYVFTDAALENCDSEGSLGMTAMYVNRRSVEERFFFSTGVPGGVMMEWQQRTKKIISTLELFAAVLALEMLSDSFRNLRVFLFVDNEASRASLISMKSSVSFHNFLLRQLVGIVQNAGLYVWTARVPSSSNPADKPSRKVINHLLKEGFKRLDVDWRRKTHLTSGQKIVCYQVLVTLLTAFSCFDSCV